MNVWMTSSPDSRRRTCSHPPPTDVYTGPSSGCQVDVRQGACPYRTVRSPSVTGGHCQAACQAVRLPTDCQAVPVATRLSGGPVSARLSGSPVAAMPPHCQAVPIVTRLSGSQVATRLSNSSGCHQVVRQSGCHQTVRPSGHRQSAQAVSVTCIKGSIIHDESAVETLKKMKRNSDVKLVASEPARE